MDLKIGRRPKCCSCWDGTWIDFRPGGNWRAGEPKRPRFPLKMHLIKKKLFIIVWRLDWDKYGLLTGHQRPSETHGEGLLEERRPFGCFQTFLEEERPLGCFQHLHLRNHTYRTVPPCKRWLMFFVWFFLCAKLIFHFLNIFVSKQFFPKYVGIWNDGFGEACLGECLTGLRTWEVYLASLKDLWGWGKIVWRGGE